MATDLITLDYLLAQTDQDETELDADTTAQLEQSITVASSLIRSYCDRDFTLTGDAVQGTRNYRYRGHSMLEIDDCTDVTAVAITPNTWSPGRTLDPSEWFAMDIDAAVLSYLEIYSVYQFVSGSPAMGFKQNLDNYPQRFYPTLMTVTAVWGWTEIPPEVQFATALTVAYLMDQDNNEGVASLTQESIATYSTTSSSRGRIILPEAPLPYKAQAMLDRFAKIAV